MDQRQATTDALPTIEEGYKYRKTNAAVVHANEALAARRALGTIAAAAPYKKGEDDDIEVGYYLLFSCTCMCRPRNPLLRAALIQTAQQPD